MKKVEGKNFGARKYVLQYDNVMNKQREIIYGERKKVLFGEDLKEYITNMTGELIESCVLPVTAGSKFPEEWDFDTLTKNLRRICPRFDGVDTSEDHLMSMTEESLIEEIKEAFAKLYTEKEEEIGVDRMRELERMILLRVVDSKWMDHIDAMDQLKSGIGLRGYGQQDPAGAYAQEGFDMFEEMIGSIKEDTVKFCYNVTLATKTERKEIISGGEEKKEDVAEVERQMAAEQAMAAGAPQAAQVPEREKPKQQPVKREEPKVGRNDPCPCGSGKKYKYCCGKDK